MRLSRRSLRLIAVLASGLFVLPACHRSTPIFGGNSNNNNGGGGGGSGSTATYQPGAIVDAGGGANPLRVDLPGRLSVLVQVTDTAGNPVAGLTNENFALYEDSQLVSRTESQQQLLPRPRVFRSFSHLLLDISGSVAQTPQGKQYEIDAAKRFIEEVTQQEENYIAISWFFGGQQIAPALLDNFSPLGFTNDRDRLIEAVENVDLIQVTSTSTNLYGAILEGLDVLDSALTTTNAGVEFQSLTLVTFTDGTDQAGLHTRDEAIARINSSANRYYAQAIGLGTEIDTATLDAIGPNGWVLADNLDQLVTTFGQVGGLVRELANSFYLVGYISPKVHSTQQRTLTVEASRQGSTATRDYPFVPQYFSGGAGFLDVRESEASEAIAEWVDLYSQPDGHTLLLARNTGPGDTSQSMTVRAMDASFEPIGTFGSGGERKLTSLAGYDFLVPKKVVSDNDGRIFVLAQAQDHVADSNPACAIAVLSSGGVLIDQLLIAPVVSGVEEVRDMRVTSDGGLVVLSRVGMAGEYRTALRRYEASTLALDGTFGAGGVRLLSSHVSALVDDPRSMVADDAGGIYYTGRGYNAVSTGLDMMVGHVLANGNLDENFGNQGIAMNQGRFAGAGPGLGRCIGIDPSGRIVVGGEVTPTGASQARAAFWRLQADGSPDTGFLGNASNPYFQSGLVVLGGGLTGDSNVLFGLESHVSQLRTVGDGSLFAAGERQNARGDLDICTWRLGVQGLFASDYNFTGFLIEDGSVGQGCHDRLGDLRYLPTGELILIGSGKALGASDSNGVIWVDRDPNRPL